MILTVVNPMTPQDAVILSVAAFVFVLLLGQLLRTLVIRA